MRNTWSLDLRNLKFLVSDLLPQDSVFQASKHRKEAAQSVTRLGR